MSYWYLVFYMRPLPFFYYLSLKAFRIFSIIIYFSYGYFFFYPALLSYLMILGWGPVPESQALKYWLEIQCIVVLWLHLSPIAVDSGCHLDALCWSRGVCLLPMQTPRSQPHIPYPCLPMVPGLSSEPVEFRGWIYLVFFSIFLCNT